ncbi:MAG: DNA methyltransferase [Hyphomicrobiales bacterium]
MSSELSNTASSNGLSIEFRLIETLRLPTNQARKHPPRQIEKIASSIETFGFNVPLLIAADGEVIAGAARLEAAKRLSFDELPVILIEHLTPAQVKAFRLADNRLTEDAVWDADALKIDIEDILEIDLDVDLELTGFEMPQIDQILHPVASTLPTTPDRDDEVPSSVEPISRRGDLWLLGTHRLLCGDATDRNDVNALLASGEDRRSSSGSPSASTQEAVGENGDRHPEPGFTGIDPVAMVFTDPPYNVPVQGHVGGKGKAKHREFVMASGEISDEAFEGFLATSLGFMADATRDGGLLYVCMDWRGLSALDRAARRLGLHQANLIVWAKTNAGMGSLYRSQHELIAIYKVGRASHTNNVQLGRYGRNRSNVWTYPGANSFGRTRNQDLADHPTVKPVAMVAEAIKDVTMPRDIVLDPFCGSGTLLLACERSGRTARALELDPAYVDIALRRFEVRNGIQPVLAGTGETVAEVRERRQHEASAASDQPPDDQTAQRHVDQPRQRTRPATNVNPPPPVRQRKRPTSCVKLETASHAEAQRGIVPARRNPAPARKRRGV